MLDNIDIQKIVQLARQAGESVMDIYTSGFFEVEEKSDSSPLTLADRTSHKIICERLAELFPDIPIISEEGKGIPFHQRKTWRYFWLVDPLDGTKEFIKRRGEFTVNIALIEYDKPILGVIYAPALDVAYYGKQGHFPYK